MDVRKKERKKKERQKKKKERKKEKTEIKKERNRKMKNKYTFHFFLSFFLPFILSFFLSFFLSYISLSFSIIFLYISKVMTNSKTEPHLNFIRLADKSVICVHSSPLHNRFYALCNMLADKGSDHNSTMFFSLGTMEEVLPNFR